MTNDSHPTDGRPRLGLADVGRAADFIAEHIVRTPVLRCAGLDAIAGAELWLKAENRQHVHAFKARGAFCAVGRLSQQQRAQGVITYSSGNHAQAVALAARSYGARATVTMPLDTPLVKLEAVQQLGAKVIFAGHTSEERRERALQVQQQIGGVIIPPFDHPDIIAGQGTATLELLEHVAEQTGGSGLDALLVPVGGGGLIAGACLAAADTDTQIYSVEPRSCDAMARSLATDQRQNVPPGQTLADGLKPVAIGQLNFEIARQRVIRGLIVDDEDIGRALVSLASYANEIVEPSGAAALGAALGGQLPAGVERVGIILSGGNIATSQFEQLRQRFTPYPLPP